MLIMLYILYVFVQKTNRMVMKIGQNVLRIGRNKRVSDDLTCSWIPARQARAFSSR